MVTAMLVLGIMSGLFGLVLSYASKRFKVEGDPVVDQINDLLPQTQCGQCNYTGCRPYAEAIAAGKADINQCPPGGEEGIRALADLLDMDPKPLNQEHGQHKEKLVAVIIEPVCIGCTLCIQACPVDAILGAPKQMHTIIESECTGCELCVPPCPVDCIDIVPLKQDIFSWKWPFPDSAPDSRDEDPANHGAAGDHGT
ncbi:MAG: electron transport complex subunit RsxB [Gammaproteobacteria bacterium]